MSLISASLLFLRYHTTGFVDHLVFVSTDAAGNAAPTVGLTGA